MPKSKFRKKTSPKQVLALSDLEHAKAAVLSSLTSASGQRTYDIPPIMVARMKLLSERQPSPGARPAETRTATQTVVVPGM
jgi:hypothetical protein